MNSTRLKVGGAVLALAIPFVGGREGLSLVAYRDTGDVPTICYGNTAGVRMGQKATKRECDAKLSADLMRHEAGMRHCMKSPDAIPAESYVAFLSWTYNIGVGAACGSTLMRKLNAGDIRGACEQLPRWNKDNGRVIRGLTGRRLAERELCLGGLK